MRYLCVHCDHRFEHEGEDKPRCPKCMRRHGIEPIAEGEGRSGGGRSRPRWVLPVAALVLVGLLGGGYAWWSKRAPDVVSGDPPLHPLAQSTIRGYARKLGADPGDMIHLFEADDAIEAFAEKATAGKASPVDKAKAVVDAIGARKSKRAFLQWPMHTPRESAPKDARGTFAVLRKDGANARLYPLEVAAVAVAALRSADVDAMLTAIYAFPGDKSPPDPSGEFGYFGIAVWKGDVGKGKPVVLDPYGGRGTAPKSDDYRVLTDVEAVAAGLDHEAFYALSQGGQSQKAFARIESARKLDPRSPSIRSTRAVILIASGGMEDGLKEMKAAAQLRPDAPRLNNLAGMAIAQQNLDDASRDVARALEQHPDFGSAHATLAAVHLANDETDQAEAEAPDR